MYCEECGCKLEDGAKFCSSCGTPVPIEEDASGKARTEWEDALPGETEAVREKRTGSRRRAAVIAGCMVCVVLIAAGTMYGIMKSRKAEEKEIPRAAVPAEKGDEEAETAEEKTSERADVEEQELTVRDYYVDYTETYKAIVRQTASEKGAYGWSLFDMDGDGMPELFVLEGTMTADFRWTAYTYDIEKGTSCFLGVVIEGPGMLYEPENREAGIIAVKAHMGAEEVDFVKKTGKDSLNITEISHADDLRREYYSTPYPLWMWKIEELDTLGSIELGDGSTGLRMPDGRGVYRVTCKVYATSVLQEPDRKHGTAHLSDIDPSTVWVEGAAGTGEGEAVVFDTRTAGSMDGLAILPGYCRDQAVYEKNGRPIKITVKCGDMVISESLENFKPDFANPLNSMIYIEFDEPVSADTLTVVISQAVSGTQYEDTCIAEMFPYFCWSPDSGY